MGCTHTYDKIGFNITSNPSEKNGTLCEAWPSELSHFRYHFGAILVLKQEFLRVKVAVKCCQFYTCLSYLGFGLKRLKINFS